MHRHSHGLLRSVNRIRLLYHLGLLHTHRLLLHRNSHRLQHLRLRLFILIFWIQVLNALHFSLCFSYFFFFLFLSECSIFTLERFVLCKMVLFILGLNLRELGSGWTGSSVWVIIVLLSLVSERSNYWSVENCPNRTNNQSETLLKGVGTILPFVWENAKPNDKDEHYHNIDTLSND